MATKLDMLFAAKAVSKEINNRVGKLEAEVKEEMLEEYLENGNDRKRSPLFGKGAGYLGVQEGKPSEKVTKFQVVDPQAVIDWMDEQRPDTDCFAQDNLELFAKWHFEHTGECPDGCTVITYDSEPGKPIVKLMVKEKVVLPMLQENMALSGEVNELLLGDGGE